MQLAPKRWSCFPSPTSSNSEDLIRQFGIFKRWKRHSRAKAGSANLSQILEGYIQYLNAYFFDRAFATKTPRKQQDRLRVLRGIARGKTARDAGLATMFQIAAWSCFHWFA